MKRLHWTTTNFATLAIFLGILVLLALPQGCSDDTAPTKDTGAKDMAQADKGGPDMTKSDAGAKDSLTPDTQPADMGPPPATPWFKSPQGIAATDKYIVVANTSGAFVSGAMTYPPTFVTIIDRKARKVVGKISTTQLNTQFVEVCSSVAYVVNTGKIAYDSSYLGSPASEGGVDIIDLSSGIPSKVDANIKLGLSTADKRIGAYGSIYITSDCKTGLLGSGTRGDVFKVDLANKKALRGPDNPIALFSTPAGKNGLTVVRPFDKGVAVADFNSDQLCVSTDIAGDLATKTCGDAGTQTTLMEGPIDVIRAPDGAALVLMSIANALYKVDTSKTPYSVNNKYATTGQANNRVLASGSYAYIINSVSNNLQRVDLTSGKSDLPYATLASSSNPYDMVITKETEGDVAWITLLMTHQVTLVNLSTGKVITTLDAK